MVFIVHRQKDKTFNFPELAAKFALLVPGRHFGTKILYGGTHKPSQTFQRHFENKWGGGGGGWPLVWSGLTVKEFLWSRRNITALIF